MQSPRRPRRRSAPSALPTCVPRATTGSTPRRSCHAAPRSMQQPRSAGSRALRWRPARRCWCRMMRWCSARHRATSTACRSPATASPPVSNSPAPCCTAFASWSSATRSACGATNPTPQRRARPLPPQPSAMPASMRSPRGSPAPAFSCGCSTRRAISASRWSTPRCFRPMAPTGISMWRPEPAATRSPR